MGIIHEVPRTADGTKRRTLDVATTRQLSPAGTIVVNDYLLDTRRLNGVLRRNAGTLGEIRNQTAQLRDGRSQMRFVDVLLDLVATVDDPHVSRGVVTVFETGLVPLTAVDVSRPMVLASYLKSVDTVNANGHDRKGALLRVGKVLGKHFVDDRSRVGEARTLLADALLTGIDPETDADAWQTVAVGVFEIQHEITVRNLGRLPKRVLERRKSILLLWESGMTSGQLAEALAKSKYKTTPDDFVEDLAYIAQLGITVPLTSDSEPLTSSVASQ